MSLFYCESCEEYRSDSSAKREETQCRVCGGLTVKIDPGRMG